MNRFRPSPLQNRPKADFSSLMNDLASLSGGPTPPPQADPTPHQPEPAPATQEAVSEPSPADMTPEIRAKIDELASVIGLAKAFSNHAELAKLLDKIQAKLQNQVDISEETITGLQNCITYFKHDSLPEVETLSQNKAGAFLNFAASLATKLYYTVAKENTLGSSKRDLARFISYLQDLLTILERYEYKISRLN